MVATTTELWGTHLYAVHVVIERPSVIAGWNTVSGHRYATDLSMYSLSQFGVSWHRIELNRRRWELWKHSRNTLKMINLAHAWQIGPFWKDTLEVSLCSIWWKLDNVCKLSREWCFNIFLCFYFAYERWQAMRWAQVDNNQWLQKASVSCGVNSLCYTSHSNCIIRKSLYFLCLMFYILMNCLIKSLPLFLIFEPQ